MKIWLFSILIIILPKGDAAQAYFLLNSECVNSYSCASDHTDISVICLNSRCVCDPRLGLYDPLRYKCVGKGTHACLGGLCTRNAFCDGATNTCKCQSGYNLSSEGHCVHGHDEFCEENEDCKHGFLCYEGKCACRFPNHQYYHVGNDTCYSIAQSWNTKLDNVMKATNCGDKSLVRVTFEILLTILNVGVLLGIAILMWKIAIAVKEMAEYFKPLVNVIQLRMETSKDSVFKTPKKSGECFNEESAAKLDGDLLGVETV